MHQQQQKNIALATCVLKSSLLKQNYCAQRNENKPFSFLADFQCLIENFYNLTRLYLNAISLNFTCS